MGCILLFFLASLGLFLNFDRDRVLAAAESRHIPVPQVLSGKPDVAFVGDDFLCRLSIMINLSMINIRPGSARKRPAHDVWQDAGVLLRRQGRLSDL